MSLARRGPWRDGLTVGEGLRLGAVAAWQSHAARNSDHAARARGDSGHVLGYAAKRSGRLDLRLGGDLCWGGMDVTRSVAALGQVLTNRQDQNVGQVFFRGGWHVTGCFRLKFPQSWMRKVSMAANRVGCRGGRG